MTGIGMTGDIVQQTIENKLNARWQIAETGVVWNYGRVKQRGRPRRWTDWL